VGTWDFWTERGKSMNKHRPTALALAACAASLTVAACSSGTPTASSSTTSTAAPGQSGSASAAASSPAAAVPGRSLAIKGKLGSFPVPAEAKVGENMTAGRGLVIAFGLIAPSDVARFYAIALPQAGYSVTTDETIQKGGDSGAYILFTGHGYRGTIDSLATFPGPTLAGLGATNVTTIIFAPTT
jgi:hypothetical protein